MHSPNIVKYWIMKCLSDEKEHNVTDISDFLNENNLINNVIGIAQLETLNEINANTKVAAFYTKKQSELTDALGFMTALR